MNKATFGQQATALSLVFVLVSCSATRPSVAGPTGPQDLAKYVLIIKPQPDGQATHEWVLVEDFELVAPTQTSYSSVTYGRIVKVANSQNDCKEEYLECLLQCRGSTRIFQVGNWVYDTQIYGRWSKGKWRYCNFACMQQLAACNENTGAEPIRFEAVQPAVDWIKKNREKILVGTIVVIAGVAFVAIMLGSGGAGLALLPAAGGAAAAAAAITINQDEQADHLTQWQ